MLPNDKVSGLKNYAVYEDIMAFFDEFDQKSKDKRKTRTGNVEKSSTRISYEKNIREFFSIVLNKEIEYLTEEDLKEIKKRDVIAYRAKLQENGNSNSTVNQKMASVKSLMTFLNGEYDVNPAKYNLKRLDEITQSYGILNQTEAELFAETAYITEQRNGFLKKMLILTAIRTSFRLDELLNLRWSNFEEFKGVYKVSVIGKRGKLVSNGITTNLYNQLLKLKEENKKSKWDGDPEIVFQIKESAVDKMMQRLRTKLNIDTERNVVFHSFRKVAVNWDLEDSNGNILKAAQQGNWSSLDVMYRNYVDKSRDYTQSAGVRMEEKIDLSFLDELTIDDFKEFIKKSDYKIQSEIQKYVKNKEL